MMSSKGAAREIVIEGVYQLLCIQSMQLASDMVEMKKEVPSETAGFDIANSQIGFHQGMKAIVESFKTFIHVEECNMERMKDFVEDMERAVKKFEETHGGADDLVERLH